MRVVKTRGMTGAYPVYNNMPTVNLPSAEVLGFRTGLEQDRPFYYSDDTQYWESQRPAELERARESYMSGFPAGVQDPATDPRMNNAIEPVYPMNWVSPAGDVEAIASSLGMLAEGDYLGGGIGAGLALAGVFLPGSFQTKSTMADGILERSLDSNGMIHPNAVRAIIDSKNTGETEKYLLSSALENVTMDPATGRVNYNELKQKVDELVPRMKAVESGDYADYGYDRVFNYDNFNGNTPQAEMVGLFPEQEGVYPVNDSHLDEQGYGHYRSAILPEDPETAYITEIQSDAATSERSRNIALEHPQANDVGNHVEFINRNSNLPPSSIGGDTPSMLDSVKGNTYDFDYDQMMETILNSENPREALDSYPIIRPDAALNHVNTRLDLFDTTIKDQEVKSIVDEAVKGIQETIQQFSSNESLMSKDDLIDLKLIDSFDSAKRKLSYRNKFDLKENIEQQLGAYWDEVFGSVSENKPSQYDKQRFIRLFFSQDDGGLMNISMSQKNPMVKQAYEELKDIQSAERLLKELEISIDALYQGPGLNSRTFFDALELDINRGLDYNTLQEMKGYTPSPITKSSIKNYTERILQEAVDDIVSKNPQAKRIRIPVGKTAATIQGHDSVKGSTAKYNKMDKTIKRVFGVKPKKVSGPRDFEYWEFDLPEGGFEKQVFKFGGKIKPIKKRKGKFGIVKR